MSRIDDIEMGLNAPFEANAEVGLSDSNALVMCRCGFNPATEPHSCPYAEEIGNNDDPEFCTCCAACQHECAMDI